MMRYLLMLAGLVCGLFLCGCNEGGNSSNAPDNAAVSFTVQWPDESSAGDGSENLAAALSDDCAGRGVSTVAVRVNTSAGATVTSGTFDCNARQGTLSGITPGSGYTIIVSGLNASGTSTHQGQKTGVTLNPGANNIGVIDVTRINNTKPVAAITSPAGGSTYQPGASVTFSGTGTDAEDGHASGSDLVWTSNLNGQIGTGTSFTFTSLSTGTHTITLTVTDSKGATATKTVTVTISAAANQSPSCNITSPANNSAYSIGDIVSFVGTGADIEDGALPASAFVWSSSIDGQIKSGSKSFSITTLSASVHIITLTVTDSNGATSSKSININVSNGKLPDTGQTKCYDKDGNVITCPIPGNSLAQDGSYNINSMSYTSNNDGTVTDNITGLMWQQQDDGNLYNWYQASGTYDPVENSTSKSVCGELKTGGDSDWRLPTIKELMSIVNYGTNNPSINSTYFFDTKLDSYWSSSSFFSDGQRYMWDVDFYDGNVKESEHSSSWVHPDLYYVRCVRGALLNFGNFVDNGSTVTDLSTGLIWQKQDDGVKRTWEEALSYCENLSLAGRNDWRLPNTKESRTLTVDTIPGIDRTYFPNPSGGYWTSTSLLLSPTSAWFMQGDYGGIGYGYLKSYGFCARCVCGP